MNTKKDWMMEELRSAIRARDAISHRIMKAIDQGIDPEEHDTEAYAVFNNKVKKLESILIA